MQTSVIAKLMPAPATKFRWKIALLMWGAVAINYIDRTNLSAAAPIIMKEFSLSVTDMGFIMSAFFWAYALFQIPAGWLADKVGQRKVYAGSVAWWSFATMIMGVGQGIASFTGIRVLLGVGEAGGYPCNTGVTAKWFPDKERSRVSAIYDSGNKVGTALAMPVLIWIIVHWGWQMTFIISGLIGFVWAALWLKYYTDPEKSKYINQAELDYIREGQAKKEGIGTRVSLRWYQLLRYRNIQAMCIGLFCLNYLFFFFITWFPTYLVQQRGLQLSTIGWVAMVPPLTGMVAEIFAGYFADCLFMRGVSLTTVRKINLVGGMLLATSVIFSGYIDSVGWLIVLLSLSYSGLVAAQSALWSLPGDIAPQGMTSMVGGMQNCIGNFGGALGPIITGYIVATTHSFNTALLVSGIITLIGALTYLLYLGKIEPMKVEV